MKSTTLRSTGKILFGWFIPGGAALLERRYARFTVLFTLVTLSVFAGLGLGGGSMMPRPEELQGLDGASRVMAEAGAIMKFVAGAPLLLANVFGYSHTFLEGRLHEQGTTLLLVAGLVNLLSQLGYVQGHVRDAEKN